MTDNRDIDAVAYDDSLMVLAGLERAKLPDLVPTGSVLGGLAPAAAAELGLLPGTPVVAGTGDLHSAAVGSGAVADFDGHLYIGTSSWISCHVPFKKTDALTNIASFPSGIPGRYLVADEHETGGACLTWLRDNVLFPDDALAPGRASAPRPSDVFAILNDMASSVPVGSHGVLFTPWLNGERSPVDDHTIRGGFHNMSLSSTRADMVRAVFEGVALNSAWLLGAVEKYCKRPFPSLAFVGGGANSDLWSQIHADATGRTIRQIEDPVLANVRGAGLLTLLALGHLSIADIPGTVTVKATYEPDPAAGEVYAALLKEFVNLYEKTKAIHKRLNGRRLQRADERLRRISGRRRRPRSPPTPTPLALRHDQRQRRGDVARQLRAQVHVGVRRHVDVHVLGGRTQRVVHVDVVAGPTQPLHQRLDVTAPVEHGPARLHRGVVGRHEVLGRVHCHATRPQARPSAPPRSPSRPPSVPRCSRAHDDHAKSNPVRSAGNAFMSTGRKATRCANSAAAAQPELVEVLQPAGPLDRRVRPARRHGGLVRLVGGHDVTAGVGEERHQRLLPDAEPDPPCARRPACPAPAAPRR